MDELVVKEEYDKLVDDCVKAIQSGKLFFKNQ
jgi:hypothetical protein